MIRGENCARIFPILMEQTVFDSKKKGLYRDSVHSLYIERVIKSRSMAQAHYHPYFELYFVTSGNCKIFAAHSVSSLSPGDVIILPPGTLHRSQYENSSVERFTLYFTEKYLEDLLPLLGKSFISEKLKKCTVAFSGEKLKTLEKCFKDLLAIQNESKSSSAESDFNTLQTKIRLLEILNLIASNTQREENLSAVKSKSQLEIEKAAKFIFENYAGEIILVQAAKMAGMRDTYFSRRFKEVTGLGFREYLLNVRIQHSMQMLLKSELSITQIATACGFSDGNYFGDIFKKITGKSPREFRKGQA
jgi:AraC-like DNA-binding protein/quercetin dioxygenase-like cupin family protein